MNLNPHIKNVCKIGQGVLCCRYLLMSGSGWECGKMRSFKGSIDLNVENMTAKGDNCEGKTKQFLNSEKS